MGFSVEEWQRADDRLTIVVIDLSESTNSAIPGGSSVLEHSKSYICSLAPAIARGRYVIIGCSTRCEKCDVFCECPSSGNTRILLRSDKKGSPPNRIREVIKPLQPQGATYIAKPIAMLQRIAMSEFELEQRQRVTTQRTAFFHGRTPSPRRGQHRPQAAAGSDVEDWSACWHNRNPLSSNHG